MIQIIQSITGLTALVVIAWLMSEQRSRVRWRVGFVGIGLQFIIALILFKIEFFQVVFVWINGAVLALQAATEAATSFVFGFLGGAELPFAENGKGSGYIFAFRALPLIIVISALSSLLFYWGVLQRVVILIAGILERSMGVSGALGVGAAANIFVGMVEAPLLIRPYLERMPRSELFALMTCGMATIAGTVMVLYGVILGGIIENAIGHILTASLISAPAAIMVAHFMVPGDYGELKAQLDNTTMGSSAMDAIVQGTTAGLRLLVSVVAMLLVFIALVHLVNQILAVLPPIGGTDLSLERILGWMLAPVVWLLGIPWNEAFVAGSLMGIKIVLNEFLAFVELTNLPDEALSPRSQLIMTYALCGFANLSSLGIMLGGLCAMAPNRREVFVSLGGRSIIAGTLATCCTGSVVGLIVLF